MRGLLLNDTSTPLFLEPIQSIDEHRLLVSMFGNMSAIYLQKELRLKSRKARGLLAFLALSENAWETREHLIGIFWSDSEEIKALASLRQSLRELRHAFIDAGFEGLQSDKLAVRIDRSKIQLDVWDVIREAEQEFRPHISLLNTPRLTESLLSGFDDLDPEFRVWLLAKRASIHDRLMRALETNLTNENIDGQRKLAFADAIVNLDPTHEEACRFLMRVRAGNGDIAAALRIYKRLWDLLADEYDMEPSALTQQLVAEIKSHAGWSDDSTHRTSSPASPSSLGTRSDNVDQRRSPDDNLSSTPPFSTVSSSEYDAIRHIVLDYVRLAVAFVDRQSVADMYIGPKISLTTLLTPSIVIDARQYLTKIILENRSSTFVLLLGDYGSGKTSLCYMLGRELARFALTNNPQYPIPVYLNLKKLRAHESIFTALARSLSDYGFNATAQQLRHFCAQTAVLLLLDGLDEAGDRTAIPSVGPIVASVQELREIPGLSWILTSRGTFFSSDAEVDQLGADIVTELQPFTEEDVSRYMEDAALTNNAVFNSFYGAHPEVRELCKIPVQLYLLVALVRQTTDIGELLPRDRPWSVNILYNEFIRHSIKANFTPRLVRWRVENRLSLLRSLAFHWFSNRVYEWTIDQFENFVAQTSHVEDVVDRAAHLANCGFFTRAHDKFRFVHLSIMEYLTAWHLSEGLFVGEFDSWEEPLYTEVYEFVALIVRARSDNISTEARKLMSTGGMRTQANFIAMAFRHRFEEILPYLRRMMFSNEGLHRALSMQGIGLYAPSLENADSLLTCARQERNGIIAVMTTLIASYWLRNYENVPFTAELRELSSRQFEITAEDAHEILGDDEDGGIKRAFRKSLVQANAYWTAPAIDLLVLAARGDEESFAAIRRIGSATEIDEIRKAFLTAESRLVIGSASGDDVIDPENSKMARQARG